MDEKARSMKALSSSVMALRRSRLGSLGGAPVRTPGMGGGASRGAPESAASRSASESSEPGGTMPALMEASSPISNGMTR
ncbi:hypothetical protein COEX109129_41825 [Corallococcus exiguus]